MKSGSMADRRNALLMGHRKTELQMSKSRGLQNEKGELLKKATRGCSAALWLVHR